MENCVGEAETGWIWTGGSTSSKDTCSEICGNGIDAAVKDGTAIVSRNNLLNHKLWLSYSGNCLLCILI